ncbi:MAG: cysteine desulfurase [Firmicutes bacterium]|nr:cysteine desulfurase [Bacillota bacterium]
MQREIYLDNSATTPVLLEVAKAMEPYWSVQYGNPSSPHMRGVAAEKTLSHSRRTLAELLGVTPNELFFTGSGTEANNIAIQGVANIPHLRKNPGHVITTAVEHPAVLHVVRYLETIGWDATYLPVDSTGSIDPEDLKASLRPETRLVSIMLVNNELGTIMPYPEIGRIVEEANAGRTIPIVLHCDAIQALGKIPVDLGALGCHLASFSAHKIGGPKGVGLLYVKQGTPLRPLMYGGGQERGLRPGTENIPGIVGLTKAAAIALENLTANAARMQKLRTLLLESIAAIPDAAVNSPAEGAPHILNVRFAGIRGEVLVHFLEQKRIYVAMGAACSSKNRGRSHVLEACGFDSDAILSSIRISLAPDLTEEDMVYTAQTLAETVAEIRQIYM